MPNSFTITGSGDTAACTRACWLLAACEAVWLPAAFVCRLAAALEPVLLPACFAMMAWTPRSNQSSQQLAPLRHGQHATALTSRPYSPQRWLLTPDSAPVACRSEAREARSRTRATGTCCRAALAPAVAAAVLRVPAAQAPARSPPAAARGHSAGILDPALPACCGRRTWPTPDRARLLSHAITLEEAVSRGSLGFPVLLPLSSVR